MTRSLAKTPSPWILPVIIVSQFAGTSLWFAGNAVLPDLQASGNIPPGSLGYVTSAVQFGFICGTLIFAFLSLSDRFSPRILFFCCALLGAAANLMIYLTPVGLGSLLFFRFMTGLFLAGIYPVGMKIAAGWYQQGLGNALGFLVGATGIIGWLQQDWAWWFPLLVFSPFIADASVTLARRTVSGARIWEAHRDHYYQRLVRMGWGHRRTALAEYTLMTLCGIAALVGLRWPHAGQMAMLLAAVLFYGLIVALVEMAWRVYRASHGNDA